MPYCVSEEQQLCKGKKQKKRGRIRDLKLIEPLWHTANLVEGKSGPENKGDIEENSIRANLETRSFGIEGYVVLKQKRHRQIAILPSLKL